MRNRDAAWIGLARSLLWQGLRGADRGGAGVWPDNSAHLYNPQASEHRLYRGQHCRRRRGKIVVGQQAIELFDWFSLKGFLGHEMAHLVSDSAARGCSDYILRDPQMEADVDALAVRTLGTGPVKAFLQRVLALTQGQDWEVKHRLEVLP